MSNRFQNLDITKLTIKNYRETLSPSLAEQVSIFIPPEGSFDDQCLRRYINVIKEFELEDPNSNMTLANRSEVGFFRYETRYYL